MRTHLLFKALLLFLHFEFFVGAWFLVSYSSFLLCSPFPVGMHCSFLGTLGQRHLTAARSCALAVVVLAEVIILTKKIVVRLSVPTVWVSEIILTCAR